MSEKFTEELCTSGLASYFDWQVNTVFPNVHLFDWEADLLIVTKAGCLWEVEVKTSMTDWKADAGKDKWESQKWKNIKKFYYAVPLNLLKASVIELEKDGKPWYHKITEQPMTKTVYEIPEWVPVRAGVLGLHLREGRVEVRLLREAQPFGNYKLTAELSLRLYRSAYFRFWSTRKHRPDDVGTVDCRDDQVLQSIAKQE